MSISTKSELRLLTNDEAKIVAVTRREGITSASDQELRQAVALLRERRDRARGIARQQRREMRGKAPSSSPASDNSGNKLKARVLSGAIQRANSELSRRKSKEKRENLVANAHRALALKQANKTGPDHPQQETANLGMQPNSSTRVDKIGSAMEAGRVSQFVRDAQAKNDARD